MVERPRIAVTGSGGYVGGRLVAALVAHGSEVRALARRPAPWLPVPTTGLDLARAGIDEIADALAGCAAVAHLAGANEVAAARDVDDALASTVIAGRRVAAAARLAGVERMVLLSTARVYGAAAVPGSTLDTRTVPAPRHPYAVARLAVEHLAAAEGPAHLVVLRLTNSVGALPDPRVNRWSLVANDLCRQAVGGHELRLRTSGHQWRDFVALIDAVTTIEAATAGQVPAGTYDLGSGISTTVLDLAELIAAEATTVLGRATTVIAPPHEGPSPEPTPVDVSPLAALGLQPTTPLREAVRETLLACVEHPAP